MKFFVYKSKEHTWSKHQIMLFPIITIFWNLPKVYFGIQFSYIFWTVRFGLEKK